jgi:hypothetical protein
MAATWETATSGGERFYPIVGTQVRRRFNDE